MTPLICSHSPGPSSPTRPLTNAHHTGPRAPCAAHEVLSPSLHVKRGEGPSQVGAVWLGISQHSRQLPCVEPPCALRFWKVTFFAQRESQVSVLKTRTKKSTHSCFLPVLPGLWAAPGPCCPPQPPAAPGRCPNTGRAMPALQPANLAEIFWRHLLQGEEPSWIDSDPQLLTLSLPITAQAAAAHFSSDFFSMRAPCPTFLSK